MKSGHLLTANLALAMFLGLGLVWVNIERVELAYDLRRLELESRELRSLVDKLEMERNNLCAPYNLRRKAPEFGLRPARTGQIRRVEAARPEPGVQ
ncbi:hypothetical protein PCS_02660 [Desulfocurvibacter africanus PCS]|uniref:Cell division protein FtsL n=1 Tax=Desulfocurvibacter africanus PCS TaxID=1262666 RepID=M5PQL8_DESAF|nr:hypothetical protein [Desulfocurvibacter africanus]EMG36647.1 hypothetical protein PCS_02660 [Desulfocurvibacter africanus PCS]